MKEKEKKVKEKEKKKMHKIQEKASILEKKLFFLDEWSIYGTQHCIFFIFHNCSLSFLNR